MTGAPNINVARFCFAVKPHMRGYEVNQLVAAVVRETFGSIGWALNPVYCGGWNGQIDPDQGMTLDIADLSDHQLHSCPALAQKLGFIFEQEAVIWYTFIAFGQVIYTNAR